MNGLIIIFYDRAKMVNIGLMILSTAEQDAIGVVKLRTRNKTEKP